MQNSQLRFGIVGTGMIAGFIADAIDKSTNAKLIAVSGRQIDTAQSFVAKRQGVAAVQGLDDFLARADVDAVYIGIPTAPKEENALAAIAAGQKIPCDKTPRNPRSLFCINKSPPPTGGAGKWVSHFC